MEMARVSTGVEGLDNMLGGGLPFGHSVLVCGGPGSGKTVFGVQFLYQGAIKYGETGLYVSLDENPSRLKRHVSGFGWDIDKLEKNGKILVVDASPIRTIPGEIKVGELSIGKNDFALYSLWAIIRAKAQEIRAKRVVIDPISNLAFQFPNVSERRRALLDLFQTISDIRVTSLIMTELRSTSLARKVRSEEFLSQGVIIFHTLAEGGRIIRAVQIEKMRGVPHDHQLRPYEINEKGIEVFPKESILTIPKSV
ncbi:MAG: hypothetical protein OEX10_07125 [Candidatus Bathyarchaeota archaeon]|nr:hypothetical protein [Candidatus Bathyarchaeota archaeon]